MLQGNLCFRNQVVLLNRNFTNVSRYKQNPRLRILCAYLEFNKVSGTLIVFLHAPMIERYANPTYISKSTGICSPRISMIFLNVHFLHAKQYRGL